MTFPGLGGQQPAPPNAPPAQTPVPGITPGVPPLLTVTEIVIEPGGQLEGIFTYSSKPPAAGTLIESASVAMVGVDAYGNNYVAGHAAYAGSFAASLNAGFVQFYTGSLAGGWTASATITTDAFGDLGLLQSAGRSVITTNTTLDDGSGNASFVNITVSTINGSSTTGSGNNGGVTSGPSGTTGAFPAAGPNHTHAEIHQHPI